MAAAIHNMDGIGGKPGWAWIFILEGLITIIASIASFFIIQDFPDTAKFLSEEERTFVVRRLQNDDRFSAGGEELRMKYILQSFMDWKTWVGSEFFCALSCYALELIRIWVECFCSWEVTVLFMHSHNSSLALSIRFVLCHLKNGIMLRGFTAWSVHVSTTSFPRSYELMTIYLCRLQSYACESFDSTSIHTRLRRDMWSWLLRRPPWSSRYHQYVTANAHIMLSLLQLTHTSLLAFSPVSAQQGTSSSSSQETLHYHI